MTFNFLKPFALTSLALLFVSIHTHAQITVSGYNHVALSVKNLQESTTFYRDVMGLESVSVPDNLKEIRSWFRVGEGSQLHLLAGRASEVTNNGLFASHVSVTIPDADASLQFLEKHNISYTLRERFDGIRQIFIHDPDGYCIELNEAQKTDKP